MTLDDVVSAIDASNLLIQAQIDTTMLMIGFVIALILAVTWRG